MLHARVVLGVYRLWLVGGSDELSHFKLNKNRIIINSKQKHASG